MNKRRWKTRNLILYISFVLIALLVYSVVIYYNTMRIVRNEQEQTNQAILHQIVSNVETNFTNIERISYGIVNNGNYSAFANATTDDVPAFDLFQLQGSLAMERNSNPYINSIYLYAPKIGKVLTDTEYSSLESFGDREWIEAYSGQRTLYKLVSRYAKKNGGSDELVLSLIRWFPEKTDAGSVVINIDLALFEEAFYSKGIRNFMTIRVTDQENMVLYDNQSNQYLSRETLFGPLDVPEGKQIFRAKEDNDSCDVYYDSSKIIGLNFFILVSRLRMMLRYYLLGFVLLLLIAVVLCVAYLTLRRVERTTLRPMDGFVSGIRSYMESNYDDISYDNLEDLYRVIVENDRHMKEQISASLPALRWRLLMGILTGEKTEYDAIAPQMQMLQMPLYPQNYMVMLVEFDRRAELLLTAPGNTVSLYVDMIYREAEKLGDNENTKSIAFKMQDDKVVCIFSFLENDVERNINEVLSYANILQSNITGKIRETISIGIGGYYVDFWNISNSYQEAVCALEYKFLSGNNAIISIEDIVFSEMTDIDNLLEQIERLKNTRLEKLEETVSHIFDSMAQRHVAPEVFQQLALQILVSLFANEDVGIYKESILSKVEYNNIYYCINQFDTLQNAKEYILNMIRDIEQGVASQSANLQSNRLVKEVVDYMNEHYADPNLSLNDVADRMGCSASHISREFKEIMGINFIDYMIDIRMKKAKEFLRNSNERISDISLMVGYVSANSFMRIFKRYTGKTPSEYRNEKE